MYTLIMPAVLKPGTQVVEAVFENGMVGAVEINCQPSGAGRMIMRVKVINHETASINSNNTKKRATGKLTMITPVMRQFVRDWLQQHRQTCTDLNQLANLKPGTVARFLEEKAERMLGSNVEAILSAVDFDQ